MYRSDNNYTSLTIYRTLKIKGHTLDSQNINQPQLHQLQLWCAVKYYWKLSEATLKKWF